MLTLEGMDRILAETTYKSGWRFWVDEDEGSLEGPRVRIFVIAANSREEGMIDLDIQTYPSPNDRASIEAFLRWLSWRVQRAESHESREFLKYQGQPIIDPHGVS